jgi:hypothetical protein
MRSRTAVLALALSLTPSLAFARHGHSGPREPPPAPRAEEVVVNKPGFVWIGGYYEWRRGEWNWIRGHAEPMRKGRTWQDGKWVRHDDHYDWKPGRWVRRVQRAPGN